MKLRAVLSLLVLVAVVATAGGVGQIDLEVVWIQPRGQAPDPVHETPVCAMRGGATSGFHNPTTCYAGGPRIGGGSWPGRCETTL